MDAWIICPFFLQGGRYTIEDVHYVADSDWFVISIHGELQQSCLNMLKTNIVEFYLCVRSLVPAGDTEFAKDAAFGYKSSNLREV